jgi:catechol 2,3-dioxygenase-like lactoylglutathione lyase family enzyme
MAKGILGIRHVTAIADEAEPNIAFYAHLLGLRLLKITVNFDDPGSYHLYYGDSSGHPGTILTFFVWLGARRARAGNSQVTATSLRPKVPFVPSINPGLQQVNLFIAAGRRDAIAGRHETQRLVQVLENARAAVTTFWHNTGYQLGQDDLDAATIWLSTWRARPVSPTR